MLGETWMSKPVITVNADDSMQMATELLKEYHIRILPVMDNPMGKLNKENIIKGGKKKW